MHILWQDLKISVRQLWRRPVFTLTAILTLAIGMGVNSVAFTVVNGILFKGPPTRDADDLVRIVTTPDSDEGGNVSVAEYERFQDATRGVVALAAEGRWSLAWHHDGTTETAWVLFVSDNYFPIVTATSLAGQVKVAPGREGMGSVVIGERFWRTRLNARSLAGLTLRLNNADVSVAGVLPESFRGPAGLYAPEIWLPLEDLERFGTSAALSKPDERWLFIFGRLQPPAGIPAVQGNVAAAAAAMAHDWPDTHRERGARVRPLNTPNSELRGLSTAAAIAMGIISLVLLLACFNVANLLLARAVERERDMGIRAAIGAGTMRLLRLVVTEALVLAVSAGAAALLLARWTQSLVGSFAIPIDVPQYIDLSPDATVLGFVALLVLIAAVVPAVWPALAAARVDVVRVLGAHGASLAGGRPSRLRQWLVGAQVAGSTAFLVIAALFAQSYSRLAFTDFGFAHKNLVVADLHPAAHGYDVNQTDRYLRALDARIRALPGVVDVAAVNHAPFFIGVAPPTRVSSSGTPCEGAACRSYPTMAIAPGYFKTMGVALTAGREFNAASADSEVIVNQPLAQQQWPDGRGLGETLQIGDQGLRVTVVGITAKTHTRGLDRESPTLYVPLGREHLQGSLSLVVRTASPPSMLVRPIIEAAQAVDANVAMPAVKTMEQRMAVQLWPFRTVSWLFSICGLLAFVLATSGLAGVVIHAVQRRRREFGVRVSVGATPRDLMSDVLRSSVRLLAPGLLVGAVIAAAVAQLLHAVFVGVNVMNPLTYVAVAALQAAVVLVACLGPARRAARVDPLAALRSE